MERLDLMLWWQQYHAVVAPLVGLLLFICLMADSCRKKPTKPVGSYRDRNYLHHQDLVDPEVRRQHLDFNAFLHESFSRERFLEADQKRPLAPNRARKCFQVSGEPGCFVAFSYATCKEVRAPVMNAMREAQNKQMRLDNLWLHHAHDLLVMLLCRSSTL
ncbi:hypothetical protein AK812_SmicGene2581 [Symbiodinium microadriaticum]|uniref:Uncharacterized protein n=1 Tax=Symbiodinium microadriaticum TaxID=2951 RepID=A0A1Q9F164_SYMMI|nr:hypothetical protein AK812_SmicGene2581 [Symbiodinium microadriaticum]